MDFLKVKDRLYLPRDAWVLALTAAIWGIGNSMSNPFQSIYFYALGSDSLFIGYLLATGSAVTALMQLVGGYVADAWGRRKVIVVFSFLAVASAWGYIFIDQYHFLMLPVMLGSIAGVYAPAFNAMLMDSMQPELRPRGIASFTLITSIPSVFCPYFGGMLVQRYGTLAGPRIAYFITGLLGLVAVSYRAMKLKETFSGANTDERKPISTFISDFMKGTSYALKYMNDDLKTLLVYSITASVGTGMTVPYTSLYLVNSLGLQAEYYGLLTNVTGLVSLMLLLPAARIVEKVGLRKSAILASLSTPLNQLIFVRAKGMDDLVSWSVLGGASGALTGPTMGSLQAELSTPEMRGRVMAIFSVFSLLVTVPGQILGGYLYNNYGPLTTFVASIPAFILATLMLTRIKDSNRKD